MRVTVAEAGNRPVILTPARKDAPQAARLAGEVLGQLDVADIGEVVLDWDNSTGRFPEGPTVKPIMYLNLLQYVPQVDRWVDVEVRVDVESVFNSHELTGDIIRDILAELVEKLAEELKTKEVN